MKNLLKFILPLALVFAFTGCEQAEDPEMLDGVSAKYSMSDEGKMVTLGFNVHFTGDYAAPDHAAECGEGTFPVKNTGMGTGTHFKTVKSYFEFCVRPTATGGTYPEGYIVAYFEDEDGDRLYFDVAGEVIGGRLPGMPSYAISYFKDPFTILDGTGKFEGASGGGFTNDYNFVDTIDGVPVQRTRHHWQGKITMKKGK
ncbi:hypothetical protein [Lentiprolixibacter aurantiacus]|uniref:Lipoprotein n=1 Tax=Lentiprolixibacter aurantiacus TaxID=2993939 RepID=A0AAE3MKI1_9FLAO|nr:hypothetical protein [Lentiprolixibacter aurantiacus]MCX2718898.1 hypothetical protein [Lentiprolixibacter aurantiacus]